MNKLVKKVIINKYVKFETSVELLRGLSTQSKPQKLSYVSRKAENPLIIDSIGQRLEYAADVFGDRECFVFKECGTRLNFLQLKEKAERLAISLIAHGLNKGDRVGIWATNCYEWIITQYATGLAGLIQVNINPAYKTNELEFSLNKVECKAIIMNAKNKNQNYIEMLNEICPELDKNRLFGHLKSKRLPYLKNVIVIGDTEYNGCISFNKLINCYYDTTATNKLNEIKRKIQSSDPINIQYTSGTTGSPKGVVLSHHMILNNAFQLGLYQHYHLKETIICLPVPLYHCFGMVMGSLTTICHGNKIVIPSSVYNVEETLKAIHNEKCTSIYGTPTMFVDLINHPNFSKYSMASVNAGVMAGSTCPKELVKDCVEKLNAKNVIVAYGLTESSPVITMSTINDPLDMRTLSIGKPVEHCEVKVVDPEGLIVPVNEPGELLVRGYNTMIGYWEELDKSQESYTPDRFMKTGDIVRVDENGFFHHLGRLKDMVIRGGENIYPKEIEDFLHTHPKIADVYVVGIPDHRMGEELCACIRLVENVKMDEKEVKDYCRKNIAHFKVPKYIEFTKDFPTTITGKIKKNVLRETMIKKLKIVSCDKNIVEQ